MTRGATPATARTTMRASGRAPARRRRARVPTISAAAPSLMPEALPAVTTPPGNSGFSPPEPLEGRVGPRVLVARPSAPGRGRRRRVPAQLPVDRSRRPWRRAYFCCEASAKRSLSSRLISCSRATLSAVSAMRIACHRLARPRIGKRAPMRRIEIGSRAIGGLGLGQDERRAAHALDAAGDEELALAEARGARAVQERASPLPHSRLTVMPAISPGGRRAAAAWRATLRRPRRPGSCSRRSRPRRCRVRCPCAPAASGSRRPADRPAGRRRAPRHSARKASGHPDRGRHRAWYS